MTKTFRPEDQPELRKSVRKRRAARRQRILASYLSSVSVNDAWDDLTLADLAGLDHAGKASAEG